MSTALIVIRAGTGNSAGAAVVTLTGGVGVAPRTRVLVSSGVLIVHAEGMSV